MSSIRDTIRSIIAGETDRHLIVNTDSFLIGLFRHPLEKDESRLKLIANFVLLLGAVIACIVAIVCSFVFFIDDVLLFRPQVRINQQGAFVPTNSCGREYVLFMFNSADPWASTGIQLCEGDRIKISASGAFNSAIRQTADAANENSRNPYPWYGSNIRKRMEIADPGEKDEVGKCIYNDTDNARFGSILYQIQPDAVPCEFDNRNRRIHQLSVQDGENFREVRENGILHFAVNDIYLTPAVIDAFAEENRKICFAAPIRSNSPGTFNGLSTAIHSNSTRKFRANRIVYALQGMASKPGSAITGTLGFGTIWARFSSTSRFSAS